jgi:rhodanese-related sulfurtransferase
MRAPTDIHSQSTMKEVLEAFPWAQRALFRHFHIGGCSSCAFDPGETLEALCQRNDGLNPTEVLDRIRESHDEDAKLWITATDAAQALKIEGGAHLVDIRTSEEWNAVHLEGSVHMSQSSMQTILSKWSRETLLIIVDHTGKTSLDAATYFQGQGFKQVRCMEGGIDAWSQQVDRSIPRYRLESA